MNLEIIEKRLADISRQSVNKASVPCKGVPQFIDLNTFVRPPHYTLGLHFKDQLSSSTSLTPHCDDCTQLIKEVREQYAKDHPRETVPELPRNTVSPHQKHFFLDGKELGSYTRAGFFVRPNTLPKRLSVKFTYPETYVISVPSKTLSNPKTHTVTLTSKEDFYAFLENPHNSKPDAPKPKKTLPPPSPDPMTRERYYHLHPRETDTGTKEFVYSGLSYGEFKGNEFNCIRLNAPVRGEVDISPTGAYTVYVEQYGHIIRLPSKESFYHFLKNPSREYQLRNPKLPNAKDVDF